MCDKDSGAGSPPPSFEDAVKRLSEIVQRLERGDLPLEESLRLFEEGVGLSRQSQAQLDGAQKRVEELLGVDRDGKTHVEALRHARRPLRPWADRAGRMLRSAP